MFSWDLRKAQVNYEKHGGGRVLLLVYTVRRTPHEQETIRIISARQASRKERKAYAGSPH